MEMQMMMLALVIENKGQTRLARRGQTVSLSLAYVLWACITRVWHSQSWWGWGRIYWIMQRSHTHQCLTNYHVEIPAFERFWQNPENPFGVLLLKYIDPSDIHEEELRPQIKDYHHHSSGDVSDKLENKSLHAGIFSSGNAFQYFGGWGRVCFMNDRKDTNEGKCSHRCKVKSFFCRTGFVGRHCTGWSHPPTSL